MNKLKEEIENINYQIKLLVLTHEKEIHKLNSENKFFKSENSKLTEDNESFKEYRERCIKLEKSLIESENTLAMKDLELAQMKNEVEKLKLDVQKKENAMNNYNSYNPHTPNMHSNNLDIFLNKPQELPKPHVKLGMYLILLYFRPK